MKKTIFQIIFLIIYGALLVFFMYECFQDSTKAGKQAGIVANIIANTIEFFTKKKVTVDDHFLLLVSKIVGHYGYFVILGLISIIYHLSLDGFNKIMRIIIHFVIGISFAFATEFVAEAITAGRNASIVDVGIDTLGFITLSLPICIVYLIKRRQKI